MYKIFINNYKYLSKISIIDTEPVMRDCDADCGDCDALCNVKLLTMEF